MLAWPGLTPLGSLCRSFLPAAVELDADAVAPPVLDASGMSTLLGPAAVPARLVAAAGRAGRTGTTLSAAAPELDAGR